MLHTYDGAFQTSCNVSKSRKFNMLNILVPILEYLSYFQHRDRHLIYFHVICDVKLNISTYDRCNEHRRRI